MGNDLMNLRSRIEESTPLQGISTSTIHYFRIIYVLSSQYEPSFSPLRRLDVGAVPIFGPLDTASWTRHLEASVGDEGVRLAAHDSNDSACSSKATFACLAPSIARDWRPSLGVDNPAEPALVNTCW
jgi:hypothetical protein